MCLCSIATGKFEMLQAMGNWIDVNKQRPKLLPGRDSSPTVLIARPLKSRPKRFYGSIGYFTRMYTGSSEYIWKDLARPDEIIATVAYWMPYPELPEG
jgi:hypothetical protein